jgi:hypothetical protein
LSINLADGTHVVRDVALSSLRLTACPTLAELQETVDTQFDL